MSRRSQEQYTSEAGSRLNENITDRHRLLPFQWDVFIWHDKNGKWKRQHLCEKKILQMMSETLVLKPVLSKSIATLCNQVTGMPVLETC